MIEENEKVCCNCKHCIRSYDKMYDMTVCRCEKQVMEEFPKGEWIRMSDLSEKDDDRYKCSRCGNVIHYKSRMDLYTFNSWCGRCGSDNRRHTTIIEADKLEEDAPTVIEAKDE